MRTPAVLAAIAIAVVLAAAAVSPSARSAEPASIQVIVVANGDGVMTVNSQTNPPGETWAWDVCSPDLAGCAPFATGRQVSTSGAGANVVFRATSNRGAVAVSPIWHGPVTAVAPPSATGALRVDALVTPAHGVWAGGWERDYFSTQLAACETPSGEGCITLTDDHYSGCPDGAAVIDPAFEGQYLRVAETDFGQDASSADYAVASPYSRTRLWPESAVTAVAVLGRIAAATGPREAACGPPPLPHATVSGSGAVEVECLRACRAVVVVRGRDRALRRVRDLAELSFAQIPVGRSLLNRVRPGPVTVTAKVDGRVLARRTIRRRFLDAPGSGVISGSVWHVGGPPGTAPRRVGASVSLYTAGGSLLEIRGTGPRRDFRFGVRADRRYLIRARSGDARCREARRFVRDGQHLRLRIVCSVR